MRQTGYLNGEFIKDNFFFRRMYILKAIVTNFIMIKMNWNIFKWDERVQAKKNCASTSYR